MGLFRRHKNLGDNASEKIDKQNPTIVPVFISGRPCVVGRLVYANLPHEEKYQRLVPTESRLATLVIKKAHLDTLHGGPSQVITQIR